MPRAKDPGSSLFHPKKKVNPYKKDADKPAPPSPQKPRPRPPRPKVEPDEDLKPPPPEGPCSEYRLMSSALNGWKYDVMKFDSRKPVDIMTWARPVKLNRKEPRRVDSAPVAAAPQAVGPMLGLDGKPVIGEDGKFVMVDAEGRPVRRTATYTPADDDSRDGKGKDKGPAKKRFQKKTKQVFPVPEPQRQLRREERTPWVMEDSQGQEVWEGQLDDTDRSETYGMFMPAANDVFKFVPAHRWYKFSKKPSFHVPSLEEAESLMSRIQKNKDPERWLLRNRNGVAPSAATSAMFKSERAGSAIPSSSSLVYNAGQSLGPGGRRLKTVDNGGGGLFGDDDDDEESGMRKRRVKRELGAEGDFDEVDFEEDFADDEEKMEADDQEDEEAKEMEERLKREYKNANKLRDGYVDESDEDETEPTLTGAGKTIQKTLRKLEKDGGYDDSDDEQNPYASSQEEEEEEEIPEVPTGPAIIPPTPRPGSQPPAQSLVNGVPLTAPPTATNGQSPVIKTESRATSPVPASHGGHSMLAKRATSPKIPKDKGIPSRAGSPLSVGRAGSPSSPTVGSPTAQSPTLSGIKPPSNKRKATDDPTSPTTPNTTGAPSKPKKRKAQNGLPVGVNGVELEDRMVIEWLKNTPEATTRDCIQYFTPYLTDEGKKKRFTALVKEVAQLHKGMLVLRPEYRGEGSPLPALSPAAA